MCKLISLLPPHFFLYFLFILLLLLLYVYACMYVSVYVDLYYVDTIYNLFYFVVSVLLLDCGHCVLS